MHVQFVPIRLVTILEVFLRETIAELVDGDSAILKKAETLVKKNEIDISFAVHIDRRDLTVGDFVAHCVSLSGIEAIVKIMDTLIGDFAAKLQSVYPRWSEQAEKWPLQPIVTDYGGMMKALARLFEIRHVLTHEIPSASMFKFDEIPKFIDAARTFIEATDWCVIAVLRGSVPMTQAAMTKIALDDLDRDEKELQAIVEKVATFSWVKREALDELQSAWSSFADKQACLIASQVEGGTMYPQIWAGEKAALVRDRITQLKVMFEPWIG